jgi:8-oxo-dGTP pyrophosphatase MutT (NUDIX family)
VVLAYIRDRLKSYEPRPIESPRAICSGVLVPLTEHEGDMSIVLTKRAQTVRFHKGEVSFPGGMCEDHDHTTLNTALRECHEEIGVAASDVEIIGRLDDMVTISGFVITPYVGIIPFPYPFRTNPREVAYLIHLPFAYLMETSPAMEQTTVAGKIHNFHAIYYRGDRIWGATCRILLQLKELLKNEKV